MNNDQIQDNQSLQQSIPPPPSGFTPEPMTNSSLSAGVDTSPAPPPPPPTGFVPETPRQYQDNQYLDINGDDNLGMQALKGTNAIGAGIGAGVLDTLNGGANLLGIPHATLTDRAHELQEQNAQNPTLNAIGKTTESISEFLLGDEALKGLSWAGKLQQVAKTAKVLEASPKLMQAVQIGARVLRTGVEGAAMGGVQSIVKAGAITSDTLGDAEKEAVETGLAGLGFGAGIEAIGGAIKGIRAIRQATDLPSVQNALQSSVRGILDKVADTANVQRPVAPSVRDAVGELADNVANRARGLYKLIDDALTTEGGDIGTNYKTFDQQISNVRREIRMDTGLDSDRSGKLLERLNDLTDLKAKAMDTAVAKGVPKETGRLADEAWRQAKSLEELQTALHQSATGLRPELSGTVQAAPEALSPNRLAPKLNNLYSSGRLESALSAEHADDLLKAVEAASLQTRRVTANRQLLGEVAKKAAIGTAGAVGLGAAGGAGYAVTKHLIQ